jgi:hypothetical protein
MQPHGRTVSGGPVDGARARALRISPRAVLTLALGLGFAGQLTYFLLWLSVRVYGSVILQFGIWGGPRVEWFENWVEPLILLSWLSIIGWALWQVLARSRVGR